MVSLAALVIPLLAVWLWGPVRGMSRRARLVAIALTALLGVTPALLLKLLQAGAMDYATLAYLQVPGGWVLGTLVLIIAFLLARDAAWLAARAAALMGGGDTWHLRLRGRRLTGTAVALALGTAGFGTAQGLQPPTVREQLVHLPQLPEALDGLRVAVLADIHASPINHTAYVQSVVERTHAARPDLIVLPGDLVDGDVGSSAAFVAPLAQLRAPHGVWAAPGNHEYYGGYNAWMAEFRRLGLGVLANQTQVLQVNGARLALSGVGDPVYGRTSHHNADPRVPEGVPPDVPAVARQARAAQADFHLLLAHQPKLARDNAAHGVDLQISGHTHGGLISGMDRWLVAPFNNGFVRGQYDVDGMRLFVSAGAGLWAGFAVRLGVQPHIDLLVLRRGTAS